MVRVCVCVCWVSSRAASRPRRSHGPENPGPRAQQKRHHHTACRPVWRYAEPASLVTLPLFFWALNGACSRGCDSSTGCRCSGQTSFGNGGADCNSVDEGKRWCYTSPGACHDGEKSNLLLNLRSSMEWSNEACAGTFKRLLAC